MIQQARIEVTTSATVVASSARVTGDQEAGISAVIKNPSTSSESVFLGDADVTTADGFELEAGAAVTVDLEEGEELHAVADTGPVEVHVLKGGVPE